MIFFLHGFLGCPEDWKHLLFELPSAWECEMVDLTKGVPESFPEGSTLVGYSMGGRIALQKNHQGGLILIGAHLGLATKKEKKARAEEEKRILHDMKSCPDTFLRQWYTQPLFTTLKVQDELLHRRRSIDFARHAELFERFALSKQPQIPPPAHALLLYGERDGKYGDMYRIFPNAKSIPDSGHAAHIENPRATAKFIQSYIEEHYGNPNCRSELAGSGNFRGHPLP